MKAYFPALTDNDLEILSKQDARTLAKWACELNSWNWPSELPDEEKPARTTKEMPRRTQLIEWIECKVGKKEVLRMHWELCKFDLDEFERFWHVHHESTDESEIEKYHQERQEKTLRDYKAISLSGHDREYYKELRRQKEQKLCIKLIGSIGFVRRELLNSVIWVGSFDENETFDSTEQIIEYHQKEYARAGIEIVETEYDGQEFRIWIKNKDI